MYLRDLASRDFVLMQADWTCARAREVMERMRPGHVVVHRTEPDDYYYLFRRADFHDRLAGVADDVPLQEGLDLHEGDAAPVLDAWIPADGLPDRVVVMDEGRVNGFLDLTVAAARPRGVLRGGYSAAAPAPAPVARSLTAEFPERVELESTTSLLVSISAVTAAGRALPVALAAGSVVDVVVQARRGFELDGAAEGRLTVVDDNELPLQFKLKATDKGPGLIRVLAFAGGQPLGMITLAPVVVDEKLDAAPSRSRTGTIEPVRASQPDLAVLILEQPSGGMPAFTFRLTARDPALGLYFKPYGPVQLKTGPLEYFTEFFKDIENLPLDTPEQRKAAELKLASRGAGLFTKLLPDDLQVLLWSLRDQIRTIQIDSDEPWIPWELLKLQGRENGRIVEGPFFAEAWAVTRWRPGLARRTSLKLGNMALVVPDDSRLKYANTERDYVLSLGAGGRKVTRVPANFLDVTEALAGGTYDGWHFTGHGAARGREPNRSALILEAKEELMAEDINGKVQNLGIPKPLVFLNACQVGRGAMSLTGIGGWAEQFLQAGAAAFIGSYWNVYDKAANEFAKALYGGLLAGDPIGTAVRAARAAVKPLEDPTWLAYTVFADPLARVE